MALVTLKEATSLTVRGRKFLKGKAQQITKPSEIASFKTDNHFSVYEQPRAPSPMAAADKVVDEEPGKPEPRTRKPKPRRPASTRG